MTVSVLIEFLDIPDHSVVLTEDTDSFIIGERVWVGGTKPGQIAYIGETQFAPGEWAGIVLDDAIGEYFVKSVLIQGVRGNNCITLSSDDP